MNRFYNLDSYLFGLRLYIPVNNFLSHVGTFSWVEPVLSNEDNLEAWSETLKTDPAKFVFYSS